MIRSLKVRLYPTEKQKKVLEDHFNGYRYAYNLCLEYKSHMWKYHKINKTGYDMQNELFEIRKEIPWLNKCKAESIRQAALDVDKSFRNLYRGAGFPKFKSRKSYNTFIINQSINCRNNTIQFLKKLIKFKTSSNYHVCLANNRIKEARFTRDKCGYYWASLMIDNYNKKDIPQFSRTIGIDMGIKTLITTSEGEQIENNKYLVKNQYKLRKLQRQHSRKKKGSKNREKSRLKLAKLHQKITWQREHQYHQITNKLINENQVIVVETLKIQNMMKNHKLARSIADVSWGELVRQLEYKCSWYGRQLIKINTFYPSSKTCNSCGNVKEQLSLSERIYNCECGYSEDRDINAAKNIRNIGTRMPEFKPVENT